MATIVEGSRKCLSPRYGGMNSAWDILEHLWGKGHAWGRPPEEHLQILHISAVGLKVPENKVVPFPPKCRALCQTPPSRGSAAGPTRAGTAGEQGCAPATHPRSRLRQERLPHSRTQPSSAHLAVVAFPRTAGLLPAPPVGWEAAIFLTPAPPSSPQPQRSLPGGSRRIAPSA